MTAIIVDTSAILAIFDESYAEHAAVARVLEKAADVLVVSPIVVAEADYMLASRLGPKAARRFAADIADEAYDLAGWASADHAAALAVIDRQGDNSDYLGIADASNVILADRNRTTTILTLASKLSVHLHDGHLVQYLHGCRRLGSACPPQ